MAAKNSIRVAMRNNAAKDDTFSGDSIDWLAEGGSLTGRLDALGNDPKSAHLYGVYGQKPEGDGMLPDKTTDCFTVVYEGNDYTCLLTANEDGTVSFDLSELAGDLDLAEGETFEVSFCYAAQMGKSGVLSTAEVTLELTGADGSPPQPVPGGEPGDPPEPIVNGGFEAGDLSGWMSIGETAVVNEYQLVSNLVTAQEGSQMAVLSTDPTFSGAVATTSDITTFLQVPGDSLDLIGNGPAIEGSAIKQTVMLSAGQEISFDYFFETQDPGGTYNDFAYFTVASGSASEIVDADMVSGTGGLSGWQSYSFVAPADGSYTIGIGVTDVMDGMGTSLLYVDNFHFV